jgi:hypothetical protein
VDPELRGGASGCNHASTDLGDEDGNVVRQLAVPRLK